MSACACQYDEYELRTEVCRPCAATVPQRTRDWYQARCGRATASKVADIIKKLKNGNWSEKRYNYMYHLMAERLTGQPQGLRFIRSLEDRVELEPEARAGYALYYDHEVTTPGFLWHPRIEMAGCSPDGFVDDDGGLEIKCLDAPNHLRLLWGGQPEAEVIEEYLPQCEFNMSCTGRQWWDFISYCPFMKDEELRLYRRRIDRDDERIKKMDDDVEAFLEEVSEKVEVIRRRIITGTEGGFMSQLVGSLAMVQEQQPAPEAAEVIPIKTKRRRTPVE